MGAACTRENFESKGYLSPTNKSNMDRKQKPSHGTRFTFILNDKEILFSPSVPSTTSTTRSTSTRFTFNNITRNEHAIDIPTYQLRNTASVEADLDPELDFDQETEDDHGTVNPQTSNQRLLVTPKYRPNLYRSDTNASWDVSDLDDLQDEMKQQLCSLSQTNMKLNKVHITDNQSMLLQTVLDRCIDAVSDCIDTDSENDPESDIDDDIMTYNDYDAILRGINGHKRSASLQANHMKTDTIPTFNWIESGHKGTNLVHTLSCDWDSEDMESEEDQMKKQLIYLRKESSNSSSGISRMHLL